MKSWLIIFLLMVSSGVGAMRHGNVSCAEKGVSIYLVRHGKTLLNALDRVQGWVDSPLNDEGKRVARYLGEGVKTIKFDRFYVSDAGRHRETLALILRQAGVTDAAVTELPGLREAFFGEFEGGPNKIMADATARRLGLADGEAMFREMSSGRLPLASVLNALAQAEKSGQAENYAQVKQRTQNALATIVKQAEAKGEKNVLVVSSGVAIQTMISDLTRAPERNKPLANGAVVRVCWRNGHYRVLEIGTMKYVAAGKALLNNA